MLHKASHRFAEQFGFRPLFVEMAAMDDDYDRPLPFSVEDGIAIIDICGMITASSYWWGTSHKEISHQIDEALEASEVKGILLCINSPGGSTDGAFETAGLVEAAGKKKPVWAVADVNCYSAAYMLAAHSAKIFAAPTSGGVGSIGVFCAHLDYSGYLEQAGIDVTLISAGKGKTDGNPYEPLSKDAKAAIQAEVDRLYGAFVEIVARGRKMTPEKVRGLGAALFQGGPNAISAGLADAAGTYEEVLEQFQASLATKEIVQVGLMGGASSTAPASAVASSAKKEDKMSQPTADVDQTPATTSPPPAPAAAATPAATEISAGEIKDIAALCQIAGKPEFAATYIASGKRLAVVRDELLAARAATQGEDVSSHVEAMTGTDSAKKAAATDPKNSPLLKAVAAMGKEAA